MWFMFTLLTILFFYILMLSIPIYRNYKSIGISNYLKLIKIIKHVIECCQNVSKDLVYIEKNVSILAASITSKALKGKLDEDDERVLDIFKNQDLQEITEKLNKVADQALEIQKRSPTSKIIEEFSKVLETRNNEDIIHFFLSERDLENCRSVYFVKKQIQKVLE